MKNKVSIKEGIRLKTIKNKIDVEIIRIDSTRMEFIPSIKDLIKIIATEDKFFVIDKAVYKYHINNLKPIISKYPFIILPVSEKVKSWKTLKLIIDESIKAGISRKGFLVAIGGGVTTDMTGLAANFYFRGIKIILVPTSLLGMVDAAVGGKVAVNHPHQKNMIGSFYHPNSVLFSVEFLKTLPRRHMLSAAGEVLKLAILSQTKLFKIIENAPSDWWLDMDFLNKIIRLSATEKLHMLGENCFERDLKRILNLGHSIAHPLEDITKFRVLHGEAVAYGTLIACNISKQRRILPENEYLRILKVAEKLNLQTTINGYDINELWLRVRRLIKQRGGKGLLYVLPSGIGTATIVNDITREELILAVSDLARGSKKSI